MADKDTETQEQAAQRPDFKGPSASAPARRMPGRRVSDVVDNGLWPDLPQRPSDDLVGVDFIIDEIRTLKSQEFGTDYCVIKCTDPDDGEEFTTICGGTVVVEKLQALASGRHFPITGSFTKVKAKRGGREYLDLV